MGTLRDAQGVVFRFFKKKLNPIFLNESNEWNSFGWRKNVRQRVLSAAVIGISVERDGCDESINRIFFFIHSIRLKWIFNQVPPVGLVKLKTQQPKHVDCVLSRQTMKTFWVGKNTNPNIGNATRKAPPSFGGFTTHATDEDKRWSFLASRKIIIDGMNEWRSLLTPFVEHNKCSIETFIHWRSVCKGTRRSSSCCTCSSCRCCFTPSASAHLRGPMKRFWPVE